LLYILLSENDCQNIKVSKIIYVHRQHSMGKKKVYLPSVQLPLVVESPIPLPDSKQKAA
jgi:hypothetical protein